MKRKLNIAALAILAILYAGCDSEDPQPTLAEIEYELFGLALDEIMNENNLVILQAETTDGLVKTSIQESKLEQVIEQVPEIENSLIQGLTDVNEEALIFEDKFELPHRDITIVTKEEIVAVFDGLNWNEAWEAFHEAYGQNASRLAMSKVAFNDSFTKAILVGAAGAGSYSGFAVYFEVQGGQWTVKNVVWTWHT